MRDIAGHVHIPAEMELATTKSIMSINMRLIVFGNTVQYLDRLADRRLRDKKQLGGLGKTECGGNVIENLI